MDVDAKHLEGRVVGSMQTPVDKEVKGGQKLAKSCGCLLWMAPNINNTGEQIKKLLPEVFQLI